MTTAPKSPDDGRAPGEIPLSEIEAILEGRHGNPFAVLGLHKLPTGYHVRCFIPGAEEVAAFSLDGTRLGILKRRHEAGFFEGPVEATSLKPIRYRARRGGDDEWAVTDAYSFGPVLGPMDDYFVREGSHLRLFDKMGAHPIRHQGVDGFHFAVWAPNARRVSVVGDFNDWDGRLHVMRLRQDTGIWEIFAPDVPAGCSYKFEIIGRNGERLLKADPYARRAELRPKTASVTAAELKQEWEDEAHRSHWEKADHRRQPISIYEVHAGSWQRRDDGSFLSWDELGSRLIPYVVDMGFTHIEFLPITEHPYDPSWGYQTTGLYAPTARFGDPEGFARFVNGCHKVGIGVILDWVPAHFPTDEHGLRHFDGTALYEHEDPRQGFHPDWNTAIYNFGRLEVLSYLVNNALYWAEKFHLDGLRVDAVASMLYLDYSRKDGEWIPNEYGGRENLEAVRFLQRLNTLSYGNHPGVMTIAEESTSWPKVSHPVHEGGLGFGFKWNMGFMHDTLSYMKREPIHRKHHHNEITFGLIYAFSENFVLPLSHDEVVHGKGSLIAKMAGDDWQKFANLRAYYAFMWGYPGKKLLFMGQEFAQWSEWSEAKALDWNLLHYHQHEGMRRLVRDLNLCYRAKPALHARDCEPEGFRWLVADDHDNSVFAWLRMAPGERPVAVITNFTPAYRENHRIPLPTAGRWREILNTDAEIYGGSGKGNGGRVQAVDAGGTVSAQMTLPPLATIMLELEQA